jgi:hypothetical protein
MSSLAGFFPPHMAACRTLHLGGSHPPMRGGHIETSLVGSSWKPNKAVYVPAIHSRLAGLFVREAKMRSLLGEGRSERAV